MKKVQAAFIINRKKQHLLDIYIQIFHMICVFTITFDQFNMSLQNKSINFHLNKS